MAAYILRRLLLIIPTVFGIMVVSFLVIQFAPGGPVEQVLLAGVGHVPHREQPEQVLARIAQFLRPVS